MSRKIYGYARVSTLSQNIDRQIRNIYKEYPNAEIIQEKYTGRKLDGREEFNKLLKKVKPGDLIIFDSVSRMSRSFQDGINLYMDLYNKGIDLEFIKEPHINTSTYKDALKNNSIAMTGDDVDLILEGINKYLMKLATKQIELAFERAELEVTELRQRTKEGIETARLNGKQIGQKAGKKLKVKKSIPAKKDILKFSRDFEGTLKDVDVIRLTGLARNTYYKYKKELTEELKNIDKSNYKNND